jgi:hypothetical protein
MKLYIAGPMSGIPQFNIPTFDKAAQELRDLDYDVVTPAELDDPEFREWCLDSPDGDLSKVPAHLQRTWGDLLARDVKLIADGDIEVIYVLPGWQGSRGARLETVVGHLAGLPVFSVSNDEPVPLFTLAEAWATGQ